MYKELTRLKDRKPDGHRDRLSANQTESLTNRMTNRQTDRNEN